MLYDVSHSLHINSSNHVVIFSHKSLLSVCVCAESSLHVARRRRRSLLLKERMRCQRMLWFAVNTSSSAQWR